MPELTARVDCDVLQADGGTRTAAITGAWVALADAFDVLVDDEKLERNPIVRNVAAVSVGIIGDDVLLDLQYSEDAGADVDCNIVMTGEGDLVEIQGTAEGDPFSRAQLDEMLRLGSEGIAELVSLQNSVRAS